MRYHIDNKKSYGHNMQLYIPLSSFIYLTLSDAKYTLNNKAIVNIG